MSRFGGNAIIQFGILFFFHSLSYETVKGSVTVTDPLKDYTIVEVLGRLHLQCNARCTNSTCEYKWISKNFALKGDMTLNSISISNVPRSSGPYTFTCTVTDKGDKRTGTCTRNVRVNYAPDVTVKNEPDGVKCEAQGNPSNCTFVSLQQIVEGVVVRTLKETQHLTLNSSYENRGKYECIVSNGIKSYKNNRTHQKASVDIIRDVKPIVLTSLNVTQKVSKGDNFSTKMKVYSYPPGLQAKVFKEEENTSQGIDVSYAKISVHVLPVSVKFYNKSISVNGTHIHFNINRMKEDYFGFYTITVQNDMGQTNVSAQIIPQGPPDAPVYFEVSHISHESVTFHLTSGFYNGANQTLLIEYRTDNGSKWINGSRVDVGSQQNKTVRMEVTGLKPETTYTFRAYCFNMFNSSDAVERVVVTAQEPTNWLVIGLAVSAGVIVIILVVAFILLRVKFRSKKKIPRMLPRVEVNDIYVRDNDMTDNCPEVYENAHLKGAESEIYENTTAKPSPSQGFKIQKQESNYANLAIPGMSTFQCAFGRKKTSLPDDTVIYSNTNGMTGTNNATNNTTTKEKHYANVQPVEVEDDDYLDMDVAQSTPKLISLKPKNVKYTSKKVSVSTSFRDNDIRKNNFAGIVKKKPEPEGESSEPTELYMDMEAGKRESMPNYMAPPPPKQHNTQFSDDYINLRKKVASAPTHAFLKLSFTTTSDNILPKLLAAFPRNHHQTMVSGKRGMNPVAMTIINPWEEID